MGSRFLLKYSSRISMHVGPSLRRRSTPSLAISASSRLSTYSTSRRRRETFCRGTCRRAPRNRSDYCDAGFAYSPSAGFLKYSRRISPIVELCERSSLRAFRRSGFSTSAGTYTVTVQRFFTLWRFTLVPGLIVLFLSAVQRTPCLQPCGALPLLVGTRLSTARLSAVLPTMARFRLGERFSRDFRPSIG